MTSQMRAQTGKGTPGSFAPAGTAGNADTVAARGYGTEPEPLPEPVHEFRVTGHNLTTGEFTRGDRDDYDMNAPIPALIGLGRRTRRLPVPDC